MLSGQYQRGGRQESSFSPLGDNCGISRVVVEDRRRAEISEQLGYGLGND